MGVEGGMHPSELASPLGLCLEGGRTHVAEVFLDMNWGFGTYALRISQASRRHLAEGNVVWLARTGNDARGASTVKLIWEPL